jgi:hypothetical protein
MPAPPGAQLEGDEPGASSPLEPESALLDSPSALLDPESALLDIMGSMVLEPEYAPLLESAPPSPAESAAPLAPPPEGAVASLAPESPFPWVSPPFALGQPADMPATNPSTPS